jgi:hypothetical protein
MFGHIAKKRAVHGSQHIASTVDYVREGRKNNFDARLGASLLRPLRSK